MDDGRADLLDALADEFNCTEEERAFIMAQEDKRLDAMMFGTPITEIKPTHTLWQIIQWIIKFGEIKKTIPLAGGRMTTREEVVDTECGKYYFKTGWYTKDGLSAHTLTPDEFILDLVKGQVSDGKVI